MADLLLISSVTGYPVTTRSQRSTRGTVRPAETSPPWGGEPLDDIRPSLRAEAAATPRDAARLRHELAAWLALDVPDEPLEDLVLATYEAIANAAEHAYADHIDTAGPVHAPARPRRPHRPEPHRNRRPPTHMFTDSRACVVGGDVGQAALADVERG